MFYLVGGLPVQSPFWPFDSQLLVDGMRVGERGIVWELRIAAASEGRKTGEVLR